MTFTVDPEAGEGELYLCGQDCYSNKIVGCSIATHMRASLAVSALRNAIALRDPHGVVVHSDRGSNSGRRPADVCCAAMGRAGRWAGSGRACGDNAAMESFFSLLQKNVLDTRRWRTREALQSAIVPGRDEVSRKRRQRTPGQAHPGRV
ncbi:DDE-type integrase/transposase/recombinase [Amycolatopsis balhimycina]|uniref:DDE-type integrase/transposase/recombinase n=1 Tax=Amycolatopsis balhimycina TaxID=208443 RepID=UPI0003A840E8